MVDDAAAVRALLGRDPQGPFTVVVRDAAGGPVVIRNAPLLDDGTPMPTRFWLVGAPEVLAVSRLESLGGVRAAEAAVDAADLADAHRRYAAERDADLPADVAHRPSGGVGGTREGVKCLHAHYAWFLAGGNDPVGRWVDGQLARRLDVEIGDQTTLVSHAGHDWRLPVGPATLLADQLPDPDPPHPSELTNALGAVADHLDDVLHDRPAVLDTSQVHVRGDHAWHLATVEHGKPLDGTVHDIGRDELEELFRALATESRADRRHNPGLDPVQVDTVLATICIVVATMRTLHLDRIRVETTPSLAGPARTR